MSISRLIWIFQIVIASALLAMAAATWLGVRAANDYLDRVQLSRQQLDAAMQLAIESNRFSEQIAELLLVGETERADFESARASTSAAIADLRTITLRELDVVTDPEEREAEQSELARIDKMSTEFRAIADVYQQSLFLNLRGEKAAAVELFRSEIENRHDAAFNALIASAVADEKAEVAASDLQAKRYSRQLFSGTILLLGLLLAASVIAGLLFARALKWPLKELTEAALAVERGDLGRKVSHAKIDEFGVLARQFNTMAGELQHQRQTLLEAQGHLEGEVKERTRELEAAVRQLTQVDQQRVKLLADISHELKTPLTVLRGEAEVALRGNGKGEGVYRDSLANIVSQAADMGRLVDDLLFLARAEVNEVRFDFRPVELAGLISQSVADITVIARNRSITLNIDEPAKDVFVRADPRRLRQAFLVVADNAVKYSSAEIKVDVGSALGEVTVKVMNDGQAIDPLELPHVFERFYRASNAAPLGQPGSGLGLPIARWIVEKHGGRMSLTSKAKRGTEVAITLPQVLPP